MAWSELEQAFAEDLILLGATTGPKLLYLLARREGDPTPLWDQAAQAGLAPAPALAEARALAQAALDAAGPQAFSFSEGAMVGPWELLEQRGQWIGGDVWWAQQGDRKALLRLFPPGTGQDAARRLRFVERSNPGLEPPHPSILRIDEADEDFGWLYTATVGFDGRALAAVRAQGPLSEPTAIALAQSLAGSVGVVHALGVVHGGLNPLGALVADGRTYLSDFGACSALLDGPVAGCRPGGRLGLLLGASPGLLAGDAARGLDARDDLFAIGAIVYYAVCKPGAGDQRAEPDAPWLVAPPVSPGLRAVLARLLAPSPDACYPDARALQADLARVAQGQLPGPLPAGGEPARGRRSPTAAPQAPVRPPPPKAAAAPAAARTTSRRAAAAAPAPAPPPEPAGEPEADDRPSRRLGKASQVGKALEAPRRRAREPGEDAPVGAGWGIFAGALVLLLGGLVLANVATAPSGLALGRARLVDAARLARLEPVRYAEALAALDEALPALRGRADLLRDALALHDAVLEGARAERLALLGDDERGQEKAAAAAAALTELAQRARGTDVEALVAWDLARARGGLDPRGWERVGLDLLARGHAGPAARAFQEGGRGALQAQAESLAAMVFVPGGPWLVPGEGDAVEVVTREPVWIGRCEVTRGEYAAFWAAVHQGDDPRKAWEPGAPDDAPRPPDGWDPRAVGPADARLPATGLDWFDARAFARWSRAELADPATLVAAARGRAARRFPWGDLAPDLGLANVAGRLPGPTPVGCFPAGRGVGGALDLLGNVEEWCAAGAAGESPSAAPVFGGTWDTPAGDVSAAAREAAAGDRAPARGLRLLRRLPPRS